MTEHRHNLVARNLDQACPERSRRITEAKDLQERRRLVHNRSQIGGVDLPALGQLADHELGVGVNEGAVHGWELACPSPIILSAPPGKLPMAVIPSEARRPPCLARTGQAGIPRNPQS